jgi:hypothetical protein
MMKRNISWMAGPMAVAILVAGCGGGGGGGGFVPPVAGTGTTPPSTVPSPPAQVDPLDKFIAYVKSLVASALDTVEPADVSAFDPPQTSEAREPVATP